MKIQYQDKILDVKESVTINELFQKEIQTRENTVIAAKFNNEYKNLEYVLHKDGNVELIDVTSKEGIKVYIRTLTFIVGKAFEKICPDKKLNVNYQLSNAMFYDVEGIDISEELIQELEDEMRKIVEQDLPIKQVVMNREEAEKFYEQNDTSKGRLQFNLENNNKIYMYYCEDYFNYCFGTLANRTGCVNIFKLVKDNKGFLVRYPNQKDPNKMPEIVNTKKLSWALAEYEEIHRLLNINNVYKLNNAIKDNKTSEIIMLAEALHEKKIANIADKIAQNRNVKMILIAGPSSSGKTTFAQRLGIQLKLNGIKPVTISVDNYFVERKDTPKDENGDYDFECIEAIDLKLFNDHLTKLLNGEEVEMPEFDFHVGTKRYNGKKLKLEKDESVSN